MDPSRSSSDQPGPLVISIPVPGGFVRVSVTQTFEPAATETPAQEAQPQPAPSLDNRTEEKATENQVRKVFAEMHRIGDDLAKAYMQGHFGTTNPATLHKKAASDLIKWLVSQPAKRG